MTNKTKIENVLIENAGFSNSLERCSTAIDKKFASREEVVEELKAILDCLNEKKVKELIVKLGENNG